HYVGFMRVLNGISQEYHGSWVLPTGLDSPLVDLLGVRYVVVPAIASPDRPEIERLARVWPVVYRDADVRVLENLGAFPRAWLVHGTVPGGADALAKGIADGSLDLRTEAVVDSAVPNLGPSSDPSAERVTVTHYSPNAMSVQVTANVPALLVTSEVDYPAWQAYVDDKPVDTVRANVAFRAVAVSPGTHTVEFRYESTALNAGLLLSGTGYLGAFAMAGLVVKGRVRRSRWVR
ncbi:MAG: YfhO family protein, partial [Chloroflexota bacterium]|nr:YfhO family protein [Chloroflexota bacterium]